jgi:hypothetical protein
MRSPRYRDKSFFSDLIAGVFNFKAFKPDFCQKFAEEIDNWEDHNRKLLISPNSISRYGAQLNKMGFKELLDDIMTKIIHPLVHNKVFYSFLQASVWFKDQGGDTIKYQHSFSTKYSATADRDLKSHTDDSTITFNVCLGKPGFEGSPVYFEGVRETSITKIPKAMSAFDQQQVQEIHHKIGMGLLHVGSHVHGAKKITAGERVNLIVWCRDKEYIFLE